LSKEIESNYREVLRDLDNLVQGPSRLDLDEHAEQRRLYWDSDKRDVSVVPKEGPIEVWGGASWSDLLSLARLCSVAQVHGWSVYVRPSRLTGQSPDETALQLVGRRTNKKLSAMWSAFCSPDYEAFLASAEQLHCETATQFARCLTVMRRGEGGVLSAFDHALLSAVTGAWHSPARAYVTLRRATGLVARWLAEAGDDVVARRLAEWHEASPDLVERRPAAGGGPMTQAEFRIVAIQAIHERLMSALAFKVGGMTM
jgi:hypothetical protein